MNANESNRRNSYESDDELATVYERPTSDQAKDRLNNADSATLNGWDVTLDEEDELKNDGQHESDSDSLDLDEDKLEQAQEDVAYVDALLNGEDPEADEDNEDDSQEESECDECGESPGHEVFDDRCHECFIDAADRILETNPDDLVTDGGVETLASIESERTRDDYVDIEKVLEEAAEERELMVRQKDNGSERFLKGEYGKYIHRDDEPCEDAPERPILRFDVKRSTGPADLCPDCEWPDWVHALQKEKEKKREEMKEVFA